MARAAGRLPNSASAAGLIGIRCFRVSAASEPDAAALTGRQPVSGAPRLVWAERERRNDAHKELDTNAHGKAGPVIRRLETLAGTHRFKVMIR